MAWSVTDGRGCWSVLIRTLREDGRRGEELPGRRLRAVARRGATAEARRSWRYACLDAATWVQMQRCNGSRCQAFWRQQMTQSTRGAGRVVRDCIFCNAGSHAENGHILSYGGVRACASSRSRRRRVSQPSARIVRPRWRQTCVKTRVETCVDTCRRTTVQTAENTGIDATDKTTVYPGVDTAVQATFTTRGTQRCRAHDISSAAHAHVTGRIETPYEHRLYKPAIAKSPSTPPPAVAPPK